MSPGIPRKKSQKSRETTYVNEVTHVSIQIAQTGYNAKGHNVNFKPWEPLKADCARIDDDGYYGQEKGTGTILFGTRFAVAERIGLQGTWGDGGAAVSVCQSDTLG
ncbi:hypothetical protein GF380_00415 [Candidatus Uhrbacteria bacterium]|nr:hypothetical protein [Candidatus Uhrbacteria bacterium]